MFKKKSYFTIKNGLLKNKKIFFKTTSNIKPTKALIKKVFYSQISIYKKIYNLELFAGTGIISFDLFSQKIKKNILIEHNKQAVHTLIKNKQIYIKSYNFIIHLTDSYAWLKKIKLLNVSLIILDPPYTINYIDIYLKQLQKIKTLKRYTLIFLEHNKLITLKNCLLDHFILNKNKYGITFLIMIKKI
jgi:16S rRNA (guanine(966)-N(2))-methyltransferase RsmD